MKKGIVVMAMVASLLMLAGCPQDPPVEPAIVVVPPLAVGADGGFETAAEATTPCGKACVKLRSYRCEEGFTTQDGARCIDVCKSAGKLLRVDCVVDAQSESDVKHCSVRCRKV